MVFTLFGYGEENDMIDSTVNLKEAFEEGNLQLVVYYLPFELLTRVPVNQEWIKNNYYYKIVVNPLGLLELRNFMEEIIVSNYNTLDSSERFDLRVHGEFVKDEEVVFSFSITEPNSIVLVNNNFTSSNQIFYNLVKEILPCRLLTKNHSLHE
jgi:hypothetical protein